MAKDKRIFVCSDCKRSQTTWSGACKACGEAGTLQEATVPAQSPRASAQSTRRPQRGVAGSGGGGAGLGFDLLHGAGIGETPEHPDRLSTSIGELDRVLGGGLVHGSAILIGGDPGVGKSTLLLQLAARMSDRVQAVYVSAEETVSQVQLRGRRLDLAGAAVRIVATSDALAVGDAIAGMPAGSLVVIDSLQTMDSGEGGSPGGVAQVKACATILVSAAKYAGVTLVLVNHVAKDGTLAGPNLIKHMVDVTLHLEPDHASGVLRLLRASKNRFGPADEVGVFSMARSGMVEVSNPSEMLIGERDIGAHGVAIFPHMDGSRPLLLEVQALLSPAAYGSGRRSATGWDTGRLHMLLAVIQSRLGIALGDQDVFVNVAGGIRVSEPAMDLAVAAAVLSSRTQIPIPSDMAVFGEVGLGGEVRGAPHGDARIREARKLGFRRLLIPAIGGDQADNQDEYGAGLTSRGGRGVAATTTNSGASVKAGETLPMRRILDLVSVLETARG